MSRINKFLKFKKKKMNIFGRNERTLLLSSFASSKIKEKKREERKKERKKKERKNE
jgi:hypothetical protein